MGSSTDRIEKKLVVRAPRERVWRALTNVDEFNSWFRVKLEGKFEPGAQLRGYIQTPGFEHVQMDVIVARMELERVFSYRWHPYAVDPNVDYSSEERTLVEFTLEDHPDGTALTVVESGFDKVPASRRNKAFEMNSGGWAAQMQNIAKHVAA
jgi:uncharacterized protein YndB with AHSA1/START domain